MKLKALCIMSVVLVTIFPPLQTYSKWHLKTFSDGFAYTFLNVTYLPYDYKIDSWTGVIEANEPVVLDINHRYKGRYDVYVMGEVVKNIDLNYIVDLICSSGERLIFKSKDIAATKLMREKHNDILLGTYLVENLDGFRDCMIEMKSANFSNPIGLRFLKKTHW
jgi:hypothetical protein